jgi:predicted acyltransferase
MEKIKKNSQRIISLDYFRGATICLMIIVSMPGNYETTYAPLLHAQWHGFTLTDLVFPSFLFASGNAVAITIEKSNLSKQQQITKALKRAGTIFLLGILLYWFPFFSFDSNGFKWLPISEIRIMGVLQRIALCYFIVIILIQYLPANYIFLIGLLLLPLYWYLLHILPHGEDIMGIRDNAATILDLRLLGEKHMYYGEGFAFEPEGILSTIPALSNTIAGFLTAYYLRVKNITRCAILKLLVTGVALAATGYFWNYSFPVNKKLWSSSFVLLTTGLDIIFLMFIVYTVEIKNYNLFQNFFKIFGKNPLFIYLFFETLGKIIYMIRMPGNITLYHWIYRNIFSFAGGYLGSLLFALFFMLFCWVIAWQMDRRKIYVRI